jgi:lipopolysaccharide/colanic/teichoic acid biosynthesis glycosyltransferase
MSLVGPRPERPEFVKDLLRDIPYFSLRHVVAPGITGWAQVNYPYGASRQDAIEKLQYDIYYIKNLSPMLDLIILARTVRIVLFGRGGEMREYSANLHRLDPVIGSGSCMVNTPLSAMCARS